MLVDVEKGRNINQGKSMKNTSFMMEDVDEGKHCALVEFANWNMTRVQMISLLEIVEITAM